MRIPLRLPVLLTALGLSACGPGPAGALDVDLLALAPRPAANLGRDVVSTALAFDVSALTGTATVTFAASNSPGATLEVGDLTLHSVRVAGADIAYTRRGALVDLGLPVDATAVDLAWTYTHHNSENGAASAGYTLLWPYYCGNLFPCHSQPADGATFTLSLSGVPSGKLAVFPASIPFDAPAYQVAWTIDAYTRLDVGRTTAGTQVSAWYRAGELAAAQQGTAHLVAAFDWLERTLGPYRYGPETGPVSVNWGAGAFGGMEHHPFWHVAPAALGDEETNVHEAVHGWFGDGIRIACWEDFVLSEGTATYLAGRALEAVAPAVGAQVWASSEQQLGDLSGREPVWPATCGTVDVLRDDLFSSAPYLRGAFFLRAVALKVGAAQLDQALARFYQAHAGGAARMGELLTTIREVTGFDATSCADRWLRSTTIPAVGACP